MTEIEYSRLDPIHWPQVSGWGDKCRRRKLDLEKADRMRRRKADQFLEREKSYIEWKLNKEKK